MSDPTYQMLEIVGTSTSSSDDAIRNGLASIKAGGAYVEWFEVLQTRGQIQGDKRIVFQVTLKAGLRLIGPKNPGV